MAIDKEKTDRSLSTFMLLLTIGVAVVEVISGRYAIAALFAVLAAVYLWKRS